MVDSPPGFTHKVPCPPSWMVGRSFSGGCLRPDRVLSTRGAIRLLAVGSARGAGDRDGRAHLAPTPAPIAPGDRRGATRGSRRTCGVGVVRESSNRFRVRLGVRGLRLGHGLRIRWRAHRRTRGGLAIHNHKGTPPRGRASRPAEPSQIGRRRIGERIRAVVGRLRPGGLAQEHRLACASGWPASRDGGLTRPSVEPQFAESGSSAAAWSATVIPACFSAQSSAKSATSSHPSIAGSRCGPSNSTMSVTVFDL